MSQSNIVEVLYQDHHSWLTGWLRRKLGCPQNAADLAQDTFIRAYRAIGGFRGDAQFSTWLHRIVLNACFDRLRRLAARLLAAAIMLGGATNAGKTRRRR